MDDIIKMLVNKYEKQKDAYPKALANFMFRELIEDIHTRINIPDNEIKELNKRAVNRAVLFFEILNDPKMYKNFVVYAYGSEQWDNPEYTDEIDKIVDILIG